MFCPKCGSDNVEDAKFCRACGMDISVVPMVMTGKLNAFMEKSPKKIAKALKEQKEEEAAFTWESAMSSFFVGVAFLLIAIGGLFFVPKLFWGLIWLLIPALACMGSGLGKMLQLRHRDKLQLAQNQGQNQNRIYTPPLSQARPNMAQLPNNNRDTNEFMPRPPSVTENTTRHLGAELPTKVFDRDE